MTVLGHSQLLSQLSRIIPDSEHRAAILRSDRVQPASIDLLLGSTFREPVQSVFLGAIGLTEYETQPVARQASGIDTRGAEFGTYNCRVGDHFQPVTGLRIMPGIFVLGQTAESVSIPVSLVGRIEGRSGLARLGLVVHITAGFIDPGFFGNITLEIVNHSLNTYVLPVGLPVCQLVLEECIGAVPYRGSYQGSFGVIGSRLTMPMPANS